MLIDPEETKRQIRALCALGYPQYDLAFEIGVSEGYIGNLMNRTHVRDSTAAKVAECYERLRFTAGPSARSALLAQRKGWTA